jgi:hypothetical protein
MTTTSSSPVLVPVPPPSSTIQVTLDNFPQVRSFIQERILKKKTTWKICMMCASSTPQQMSGAIVKYQAQLAIQENKLQHMIKQCCEQGEMITTKQLEQQCKIVGRCKRVFEAFQLCRTKTRHQLCHLIDHFGSAWMKDQCKYDTIVKRWEERQRQYAADAAAMDISSHVDSNNNPMVFNHGNNNNNKRLRSMMME